MEATRRQGIIYVVAAGLTILIGILINITGNNDVRIITDFVINYLSIAHQSTLVVWMFAAFALLIGIGLVFYAVGNTIIYTSQLLVWIGEKIYLNHKRNDC